MHCVLFLFGNKKAIAQIAECRNAVWVGLLFVFIAAFAREYDQEYLLARPWFLLIPAGASLVVATLLYVVLVKVAGHTLRESYERGGYRQFVALFWMTAPLAWLYAAPYEAFLDEGGAVAANLWTLLAVSLWRVLLMIRVVNVLFATSSKHSAPPILLVSDAILIAALQALPFPLIQVMGGTSGSPAQDAVATASFCMLSLGWLSLPVWLFMTVMMKRVSRKARPWQTPLALRAESVVHRRVWLLGALPLLLGVVPLYFGQVKQRYHYLQELRSETQPAAATRAAMVLLQGLDRRHSWGATDVQRVALVAQFGPWLEVNGQQWIDYQTDDRVMLMLKQIVNYPEVRSSAPAFLKYLRRAHGTLRPGIDRELTQKILE